MQLSRSFKKAPPLFQILAMRLVLCQTWTTTSDLPFYDIFVLQKVPFSQISDDVIACDLWFAPPPLPFQSKILALPMAGMLKFFAKDKMVKNI